MQDSSNPLTITENFIKKYPESNLVLTLGKEGCIFKNKEKLVKQPIFDAKVVDTTAKGGFLTYFILNFHGRIGPNL